VRLPHVGARRPHRRAHDGTQTRIPHEVSARAPAHVRSGSRVRTIAILASRDRNGDDAVLRVAAMSGSGTGGAVEATSWRTPLLCRNTSARQRGGHASTGRSRRRGRPRRRARRPARTRHMTPRAPLRAHFAGVVPATPPARGPERQRRGAGRRSWSFVSIATDPSPRLVHIGGAAGRYSRFGCEQCCAADRARAFWFLRSWRAVRGWTSAHVGAGRKRRFLCACSAPAFPRSRRPRGPSPYARAREPV
jgi:hypothetical protein